MTYRPPSRFRFRASAGALAALLTLGSASAHADYSRPPESPYYAEPPYAAPPPEPREPERVAVSDVRAPSTFRFHVGPALLLQPSGPGLSTALDIGQRAVGGRISGSWLRAQSDGGLSSYTAELWIDFRHRYELHPILGAGASFLRGGALEHRSAGAGVLRGALEYELPIADADARVGLSVTALVPAIELERTKPWLVTSLTIGAGF